MRCPGEHLEDPQNVLALAEAVEKDGHRADVQRVRSQPYQVAVQALKFDQHHAHPLRLGRDLDIADQLFHRQRVDQIVRQVREIIHAIGQRHHLLPGFDLALFFDAGVQEPDVGNRLENGLAVQLQHDAQHAMRGGMLRTHVQDHALGAAGSGDLVQGLLGGVGRGDRIGMKCGFTHGWLYSSLAFIHPGNCICIRVPDNPCAADDLPSRSASGSGSGRDDCGNGRQTDRTLRVRTNRRCARR